MKKKSPTLQKSCSVQELKASVLSCMVTQMQYSHFSPSTVMPLLQNLLPVCCLRAGGGITYRRTKMHIFLENNAQMIFEG